MMNKPKILCARVASVFAIPCLALSLTSAAHAVPQGGIPQAVHRQFRADRRAVDMNELVLLNVKGTKVEEFFGFIVECTGKTVIPRSDQLRNATINVLSDKPVTRLKALELIFQAFRLNDVVVVETDEIIMIDVMTNMNKLLPGLVLGPSVDVLSLEETGQVCIKVFQIENTKAQAIYDRLITSNPDYAKLDVDTNSNQIILEGDVGLAKRCQELIDILDVGPFSDTRTETFRIRYTDAQVIADSITEIFSGSSATGTQARGATRGQQRPGQNQAQGAQQGTAEAPTLIVTVLAATNSLTVRAGPEMLKSIGELIATAWDIPPTKGGSIFKAYDLKFTDPLKVRDLLQSLLESGGGSGSSNRGRSGATRLAGGGGGAGGGESGADVAVANIFKIEAYPDSNRLVILTKTPDNFVWLDALMAQIDTPLDVGMPTNVQLKHASAVSVAEIINALLAESGSGTGISAPEEGVEDPSSSFDGQGATDASNTAGTGSGSGSVGGGGTIEFPWQNARGGNDETTEVSAVIGKSRVVPNANQNSLLVLATPEIESAVLRLIEELDQPGRQVMISSVLAEVVLGDQFAMGIKFGPAGQVKPLNPNNAVSIGTSVTGTKDGLFPETFNTFTFDFLLDATVILQALQRDTAVRILQQPRVFTTDNKEAQFFAGDDVPFLTGSTTGGTTGGGTTSSFNQIPVGIGLNVRPRITKERNVAMEIKVLLSNINNTSAVDVGGSGNPTISRRSTNTNVTVKNNQTIVISGLRVESEESEKNGFPVLGNLPILDLFFSNKDEAQATKELLIFITPTVVDNPDENDLNFNADERERLDVLSKPINADTQRLVEKNRLLLPEKAGGETVNPLAPIEPNITPNGK
jgi:type II secretory pathway component GspD/PulD (secretin)